MRGPARRRCGEQPFHIFVRCGGRRANVPVALRRLHGIEGEGGRGVPLTTGMFRHGGTDRDLYTTISVGIPGTEMRESSSTGARCGSWSVSCAPLARGRAAEQSKGDPQQGSGVYAANGCNGCHRIRGEGGRMVRT